MQTNKSATLATHQDQTVFQHREAGGTSQTPAVLSLMGNVIDRKAGQNGIGVREDGKSYTLDTISRHGVAYQNRKE